MPLPRHSMSGWGLQRQREWRCGFGPSPPPGYLSPVAMRARVGSGYPPLPLHGAACWLGVLFMSLMNFAGEFLPATRGNQQYDEKGECAHAYVYERICILMFSLEFPTSGLGFPQHPRGPLSQHPTKRVRIWAWHFSSWRPVRGLGFPGHTRVSLSETHQNRVCPWPMVACVCACH